MTLKPARVIKANELDPELRPAPGETGAPYPIRTRRVPRSVMQASAHAEGLLRRAETQARDVVARAERQAAEIKLRAETEGRADAAASIAAQALALAQHEARADERSLDRVIELARLLAERLLGEALAAVPERVVALARQALREARGARQIVIAAHPDDAERLKRSLLALNVEPEATRVEADPERAPGDLRIVTEIGVLDAALAPQLERLALKLRATLSHER